MSEPASESMSQARSEARVERSETRMMIDCRSVPSAPGCTVTIAGEPDELVDLAIRHAVDTHGHVDGPELRDALWAATTPTWEPVCVGEPAFRNLDVARVRPH